MLYIDFSKFKEVPKSVLVAWIIAMVSAFTGIVLILLDIFGVFPTKTYVQILPVAISSLLNIMIINKYKGILYKNKN